MGKEVLNNIQPDQSNKIVDYIENLAGGKNLRELIESGRVLRLNGQRFIPEGQKINFDPERVTYTDEESDVLDALDPKNGGVLIFDDLSTDNPKPRLLTTPNDNSIRTLTVSDPMDKDDLEDAVDDYLTENPIPDKDDIGVPKPWFGNRILDTILRIFGGSGTEEMIEYRQAQASAEFHYEAGREMHDEFNGVEDRIQNHSRELASMTRAERNINKEMQMAEQAMIPEAMGVAPEDQQYYNEFKAAMTDVAKDNYKARAMIVRLGMETITTDGHRHPSQLRQVFQAYKTERANGRDLDLKGMMESAVNQPNQPNNLTRILSGQKVIPQAKENVL